MTPNITNPSAGWQSFEEDTRWRYDFDLTFDDRSSPPIGAPARQAGRFAGALEVRLARDGRGRPTLWATFDTASAPLRLPLDRGADWSAVARRDMPGLARPALAVLCELQGMHLPAGRTIWHEVERTLLGRSRIAYRRQPDGAVLRIPVAAEQLSLLVSRPRLEAPRVRLFGRQRLTGVDGGGPLTLAGVTGYALRSSEGHRQLYRQTLRLSLRARVGAPRAAARPDIRGRVLSVLRAGRAGHGARLDAFLRRAAGGWSSLWTLLRERADLELLLALAGADTAGTRRLLRRLLLDPAAATDQRDAARVVARRLPRPDPWLHRALEGATVGILARI